LACARELVAHRCTVTVLEARSRIGGRVWTDERLGFSVDLGASWIMGAAGNPLSAIARAAGIDLVNTHWERLAGYRAGHRVSSRELNQTSQEFEELLEAIARRARSRTTDLTLQAAIVEELAGEVLSPVDRLRLDFATCMLALDAAADMDELGVIGQEFDRRPRGEDALPRGGYRRVMEQLATGLDLRLGQEVSKIEYGPTGVRVTTAGAEFTADRCVVSLPLGVLQANRVRFAPDLPTDKLAVLRRIAVGTLDKAILLMPRAIFPAGVDFLGRMGPEPSRFPMFVNLERQTGRHAVLGFVAGKTARALETSSDAQIIDAALRSLREMLGATVPEPTAAVVTRWRADPHALGSYSYIPPGAKESDRDQLSAPVGSRLFFCGEATQRGAAGTVHGAYQSGRRAATQVLGAAS
jgi:monoamine oxidase